MDTLDVFCWCIYHYFRNEKQGPLSLYSLAEPPQLLGIRSGAAYGSVRPDRLRLPWALDHMLRQETAGPRRQKSEPRPRSVPRE